MNELAGLMGLPVRVVAAGAGLAGLLAVGSVIRWVALRGTPREEQRKRLGSLAVWWVMLLVLTVAVMGGRVGGAATLAVVSLLALVEYFRLLDNKQVPTTGKLLVLLAVPATYMGLAVGGDVVFAAAVLAAATIGVTVWLVLRQVTAGFLLTAASLVWGNIVLVFLLSHMAMLFGVQADTNPVGGAAGWVMFLVVFTESDDIFQALWGRRFGRRRITPVVSPNKTWEGFVLGGITALLVGMLLAPLVTPLAQPWSLRLGGNVVQVPFAGAILAGLLLVLAGFFGDLNMSALKRDVGVKDSGNWLPGQGGILDRIDSLTFTAPVFYYFVRVVYG
jgi:phosphatidate cytidylyltransferase